MILFLLPVGSALIASGYSASLKKAKKKYLHKQTQAESELTCREVQDLWTRGIWMRHQ